jgi:hypothetical protein
MKTGIIFGALGLGFFLLLLSTLWSSLFPATSTWTNEKATRSADVKARMAYLGGIVNSPNGKGRSAAEVEKAKTEFEALKAENEQLNSEFTSAAETPQTLARVMKWSGISLAAIGIIGWYAASKTG